MFKKIFSTFTAAPLYGGFVLLLLLVASTVKHYTGFPPFLSQLGIFAVGLAIGIIAVVLGYIKEVKQAASLKIPHELVPDARYWQLEAQDATGFRKYTYGNWTLVKLSALDWVLVDENGRSRPLKDIRTQQQLNDTLQFNLMKP